MTANNPALPVTSTRKPSILRRILVFPFKVLWLLIRVAFLLAVIAALTPVAYGAYRLNQPMVMPEAQGITFRQFYAERYEAYELHQETYKVKNNACIVPFLFIATPGSMYFAPQYSLSKMYPGSRFDRMVVKDHGYQYAAPKYDVTWSTLLPATWESFERLMWYFEVLNHSSSCRIPSVNFEAARQK